MGDTEVSIPINLGITLVLLKYFVWAWFLVGLFKSQRRFQKRNIIPYFHTKIMLTKVNNLMYYKIIVVEIFLDSLMSAV